jgi:hypothetical protein
VRNARTIVMTVAAVIILLLGACDRKTVLTFGLPSIIGSAVYDSSSSGKTTAVYADVENTRLLPVVAINDESLDVEYYSSGGEYMWSSSWSKTSGLKPGDSCILYVYQSNGTARSEEQPIPQKPHITSPGSSFILKEDSSLSLAWTGTAGVDRYEISFDIQYEYGSSYNYFYLDTTVVVPGTATNYILPAASIFPSNVDSVYYGYINISVEAVSGPCIGRECKCNITGNGAGYFLTSSADNGYVSINQLWLGTRRLPRTPLERAQRMVARFRAGLENR